MKTRARANARTHVRMRAVEAGVLARAAGAASSLARDLELPVEDVVVVHNSNMVGLRLLPCDVFARTALVGQEVAAFELAVARNLGALSAPVASLDPRVEPCVYKRDGFAVTFWTYYESVTGAASPAAYANALHRLHAAMRGIEDEAPHFTERVADAEGVLTNRDQSPDLVDADRALLLDTLRSARVAIRRRVNAEQLLHGEPHPANLLRTRGGLLFIDFEACCRGPIEFDVAHVPEEVSGRYPGVDPLLLQDCRRLVLAMIAAWRWDGRDKFPNGRQHGLDILKLLRNGPPWPGLGALSTG